MGDVHNTDTSDYIPTPGDLPAIWATILPRRATGSSLHLLAWGLGMIVMGALSGSAASGDPNYGELAWLVACGTLGLGSCMSAVALVGMIARKPRAILVSAVGIASVSVWAACVLLAKGISPGLFGHPKWAAAWALVFPLPLATRELVRFLQVQRLLPLIEAVDAEQQHRMAQGLRCFVKKGESFEDARVKVLVEDGHWLTSGFFRPPFIGRLCENGMLLVSTRRSDCLWVPRKDLAAGSVTNDAVEVQSQGSAKTLRMKPVSFIALKRWLGAPVTRTDLKRVLSRKSASEPLLLALADESDPAVRELAGKALRGKDRDDGGVV